MIDLQASDIRTFLPAQDFGASMAFYEALGCRLAWSDSSMGLYELGGQRFYLQRYYVREWADNCMLHIAVADARACHERIAALLASGQFPRARVAPPKR